MNAIDGITRLNVDRGLTTFNASVEYDMIFTELQELLTGAAEEKENDMVDSLCSIMVAATGALDKLGYKPEIALLELVKEISSCKGSIDPISGKWHKDMNQYPPTLYVADYAIAKR
jgi:hypothetical protein